MPDFDDSHDPNAAGLAGPPVHAPLMRAYALCRGGFVHAVRSVEAHLRHPFGDVEMGVQGMAQDPAREHVVDVTGALCHPGYMVDNKGNVAPAGFRREPLPVDAPGYHDPHVVSPVPTPELADILARPPLPAAAGPVPSDQTDAKIEGRSEDEPPVLPEGHDADHGVQEHHDHPVHADAGEEEKEPTGFAAMDAKAHD